jgi:hypothetical protein
MHASDKQKHGGADLKTVQFNGVSHPKNHFGLASYVQVTPSPEQAKIASETHSSVPRRAL